MVRFDRVFGNDVPTAVEEAGLADLWARLSTYHFSSQLEETLVRNELIRACRTNLNGAVLRTSIAAMIRQNPDSLGTVPGVATNLAQAQAQAFERCRALVRATREDDETSEVGRVRRLAEVRWIYVATLADLDAMVAAALVAARQRAAAPVASTDRYGERFQAAIAEVNMLLSAGSTEALSDAWNRAVQRRSRPELEAWAGVASVLRGWRSRVTHTRTIAERDEGGTITTRFAVDSEQLANRIEAEWATLIDDLLTPAERSAGELRRALEREEQLLEQAYRARSGLMDLVA